MSATALVLGGTRYFGRRLVDLLVNQGYTVTVGTRGNSPVRAHERIQHLRLDRSLRSSLVETLGGRSWDVVYDQLCYAPNDALDICEVLDGCVGRYIMTSSQAVYCGGTALPESAFDPLRLNVLHGRRPDFNYRDGKRLAEAALFQHARFPVMAARLPIVLGADDYTRRLHVQVERVIAGEVIAVPALNAECSLISSGEAAAFLCWLLGRRESGAWNACSDGAISAGEIIAMIETTTGRAARIENRLEIDESAFFPASSRTLDTSKAKAAGYRFEKTEEWIVPLIEAFAAQVGS